MVESKIYKALPSEFNLAEHLLSRNKNNLQRVAFIVQNCEYRYADVLQYTQQFMQWIAPLKEASSQFRLAIIAADSIEFVIAFLGSIGCGVIPILVNELMGMASIEMALIDSR